MRLLDRAELINATVRTLNGAIPGTNKPYDAQKISDELVQMLLTELKDPSGVHVETVLATLGSLSGFSVQMALREAVVKTGKLPENKVFVIVETKDKQKFYLGDLLNEGLFESKAGNLSVFSLIGGGIQKSGGKELPNINEIAKYVVSTIGSERYGIPRVAPERSPRKKPIELLDKFWNPVRNFLVLNVQAPPHWPLVIALSAQKVIIMGKSAIDPEIAGKLVMETATSMAKIDPVNVHFAYFQSY